MNFCGFPHQNKARHNDLRVLVSVCIHKYSRHVFFLWGGDSWGFPSVQGETHQCAFESLLTQYGGFRCGWQASLWSVNLPWFSFKPQEMNGLFQNPHKKTDSWNTVPLSVRLSVLNLKVSPSIWGGLVLNSTWRGTSRRTTTQGCLLGSQTGHCVEIDVVDKYPCGQQTSPLACLRLDCLERGSGRNLSQYSEGKRVLLSWSEFLFRWAQCRKSRHLEAIILSTSDSEMPVPLRRLFLLHQTSLKSGRFTSKFVTHIRTHQSLSMQAANLNMFSTCLLYSCSLEALSDIWIGVFLAKSWSKALTIDCQWGALWPHRNLHRKY